MKRVLVLMSTYNGEKYLTEQLDSIFRQNGAEISLLVRDDGSSDGTVGILEKYAESFPLYIISGENIGPAKSFLELIIRAPEADFYALADQDDVWADDKIKTALQKIGQYDQPALYCSNLTVTDEKLNAVQDLPLPLNVQTDFMSVALDPGYYFGCTMVFNRKMKMIIEQKGNPGKMIMHDLWLALTASYSGILVYDSRSFIRYRNHTGNYTVQRKKNSLSAKLSEVKDKRKVTIAEQCSAFIDYMGIAPSAGAGAYTISRYPESFSDRMKLCLLTLKRKDMKSTRKIRTVLRILNKTY
ncbi:MAG: glycosyltransferase family 2 protein [Solobacterium sp.]|nr:glycosyltransferase family 2 protein [Solobacterium sp.]